MKNLIAILILAPLSGCGGEPVFKTSPKHIELALAACQNNDGLLHIENPYTVDMTHRDNIVIGIRYKAKVQCVNGAMFDINYAVRMV